MEIEREVLPVPMEYEITPEGLRSAIEREKELRSIIIEYFRSQMVDGYHYYRLPEAVSRLPSLKKEGALNLCTLFRVRPQPEEIRTISHEDGHYTVHARVHLVNRRGEIVATGDAARTTRESKYAYLWLWPNEVPPSLNKETLEYRIVQTKHGATKKYRVPTSNPADYLNTIVKMAKKSALVEAVLQLPLVSELFTQDIEETIEEEAHAPAPAPKEEPPREPPHKEVLDTVKEDIRAAMQRLGWSREETRWFAKGLFKKDKDFTREEMRVMADIMLAIPKLGWSKADFWKFGKSLFEREEFTLDELKIIAEKMTAMAREPLVQKALEKFGGKVEILEGEKDEEKAGEEE